MVRRDLLPAVVLLALLLSAPARGQVGLEWKFTEGDQFFLETKTSTKQSLELMGRKFPGSDTENTSILSFKVLKSGPEGVVLQQKVEAVKIKGQVGPLLALIEKTTGTVLTATLNSKGEVTKLDGFPELLRKIAGENEEAGKFVRLVLNEDMAKESIQDVFAILPGKPVSQGDAWQRKGSLSLGPLGSFQVNRDFKYEGKNKDGEAIAVKGTYKYQPPKAEGGLPFKVSKGEFKTEEAKGQLIFDPAAGRLVRSEYKLRQKGVLTLAIGDQNLDADMLLEMSFAMRILKELPKP